MRIIQISEICAPTFAGLRRKGIDLLLSAIIVVIPLDEDDLEEGANEVATPTIQATMTALIIILLTPEGLK